MLRSHFCYADTGMKMLAVFSLFICLQGGIDSKIGLTWYIKDDSIVIECEVGKMVSKVLLLDPRSQEVGYCLPKNSNCFSRRNDVLKIQQIYNKTRLILQQKRDYNGLWTCIHGQDIGKTNVSTLTGVMPSTTVSLISLDGDFEETNGTVQFKLTCSTTSNVIGYSTEFLYNNKTIDHVRYDKGLCYHKGAECKPSKCSCTEKVYNLTLDINVTNTNGTIGCEMRFDDRLKDKGIMFIQTSTIVFNGKEIMKNGFFKETDTKTSNNKTQDDDIGIIEVNLPVYIGIGVSGLLFIIVFVVALVFGVQKTLITKSSSCPESLPLQHTESNSCPESLPLQHTESSSCPESLPLQHTEMKCNMWNAELRLKLDFHEDTPTDIRGVALLAKNKIVVVDSNSSQLLFYDNNIQIGGFPVNPRGIASISDTEIVVTCDHDREIRVFEVVSNTVKNTKIIDVKDLGKPFSIDYNDGHFLVEIGEGNKGRLIIFNVETKEIKHQIANNNNNFGFFTSNTLRFALSMSKEKIIISDICKECVYCLNLKGEILMKADVSSPRDIMFGECFGPTHFVVVSKTDNAIYQINYSDGTKSLLFENAFDITRPKYIAFKNSSEGLYFCVNSKNTLVYLLLLKSA